MKGITPEEELEKMRFSGSHSIMEISITHCEDGLWRYGLSGELMDRLKSLRGFHFAPCADRPGYANKEDCFKEARADLRQGIKMNADKNPLAYKELTAWINSIMYESRQMSLF